MSQNELEYLRQLGIARQREAERLREEIFILKQLLGVLVAKNGDELIITDDDIEAVTRGPHMLDIERSETNKVYHLRWGYWMAGP